MQAPTFVISLARFRRPSLCSRESAIYELSCGVSELQNTASRAPTSTARAGGAQRETMNSSDCSSEGLRWRTMDFRKPLSHRMASID